jgi:hypothetical protein
VATATAAAATAAPAAGDGLGLGGAIAVCGAEDRKLDGVLLAGTVRASDFLGLVENDFFEVGLAVVADVFVDGHIHCLNF